MRHFSLTQRIKIAYVVSFVLLSLFSMLLLFGAVKQIEDHIFEKQLSMEVTTYVQGLKAGGNPTLPPAMAVYDDINELPERVLPYIDGVEPGIYEIEHPDDVDFHYAVTEFNSGKRLIFLYDVNNIELSDSLEWKISQLIFWAS